MAIKLLESEKYIGRIGNDCVKQDDDIINNKYQKGESRIITEQGSYKLSLIKEIFKEGGDYQLQPRFQRRVNWDVKRRSKLIESFIMNIPVPPIFIYETDFNSYEVMDGLQRLTAIVDFYNDLYELKKYLLTR